MSLGIVRCKFYMSIIRINYRISTTLQWYISSNWENEVRSTYTYDQAGNEITSLTELWQNNKWTNSGRDYSYYSPENRERLTIISKLGWE